MKTIEERAKKASVENAGWNDTLKAGIEAGYVLGATEQRDIDIYKLKDVMNALMINTYVKAEIIRLMEE